MTVPPPPGGVALKTLSKFRSPLAADSLHGLCQCVCACVCLCLCVTCWQLLFYCGWTHRPLINFRSFSLASRRTQTSRLVEHIPVLFPVRSDRFLLMARSNQDGHGLPASWRLDNDFIHWCKLYFFSLKRTIYQVDVTGLGHFQPRGHILEWTFPHWSFGELFPRLDMSGVVRTLSRCLLPAEASRDPGSSKERSRERDAAQEREARRRSREIDAMLARERRAVRRLVKILLLGAGESGKSTFLKQMRIINGQEFDKKALLDFRDTIYENILKVR